jgi:hypothetical protein
MNAPPYSTDSVQDEVLAEAIVKADAEVEKLQQEIAAKKWRMVADKMKSIKVSAILKQTPHGLLTVAFPARGQLLPKCMP